MSKEQYVLVTTKHRGVFAGYFDSQNSKGDYVELTEARCCIRWRNGKGFLGLAEDGPDEQCMISSTAPRLRLFDVTSISDVTDAAADKWLSA